MAMVLLGLTAVRSCATAARVIGVQPCKAEPNISRAKRRKLRDRRVAVRHAIVRTQDLKSTLGFTSQRGAGLGCSAVRTASLRAAAIAFELRSVEQRIDAIMMHWVYMGVTNDKTHVLRQPSLVIMMLEVNWRT